MRRLTEQEALLLAALRLQALRARGETPAPGMLDRLARQWRRRAAALPAWVAERDGDHVGLAVAALAPGLPVDLGDPHPHVRLLELHGRQERDALVLGRTVLAWAGAQGAREVELAPGPAPTATVLDALGAVVREPRRAVLPVPPA